MIVHIIMIAMSVITGVIGIALLIINLLYDCCSETTEAEIIRLESRMKSYDSTISKRMAHDYVYEYTDASGKKHTGKIIKNSPVEEYSEGDRITVRYIKIMPGFSMTCKITSIPFVLLAMSAILIILNFII